MRDGRAVRSGARAPRGGVPQDVFVFLVVFCFAISRVSVLNTFCIRGAVSAKEKTLNTCIPTASVLKCRMLVSNIINNIRSDSSVITLSLRPIGINLIFRASEVELTAACLNFSGAYRDSPRMTQHPTAIGCRHDSSNCMLLDHRPYEPHKPDKP